MVHEEGTAHARLEGTTVVHWRREGATDLSTVAKQVRLGAVESKGKVRLVGRKVRVKK